MNAYIVTSASSSIKKSTDFYSNLGYKEHSKNGDCVYLTDSQIIIEVNQNKFVRPGIRLFKSDWKNEVKELNEAISLYEIENGHAFRDQNGMWVYLQDGEPSVQVESSLPKANNGVFMGISLECTDFDKSISLYEKLGFNIGMGNRESGFLTMHSDLGIGLSLMKPFSCPHKFINPSLTFFNGKENSSLIQKVFKAGIIPLEIPDAFGDSQVIENVILRDEGGYGIFMFND